MTSSTNIVCGVTITYAGMVRPDDFLNWARQYAVLHKNIAASETKVVKAEAKLLTRPMPSARLQAEVDGERLTEAQFDSFVMLLSVAGTSVVRFVPPLIVHREFDAASFAAVTGLSTAISGTVCALGPGLIGLVRSWSGDYHAALVLCIALELAAAVIVVWGTAPTKGGV